MRAFDRLPDWGRAIAAPCRERAFPCLTVFA